MIFPNAVVDRITNQKKVIKVKKKPTNDDEQIGREKYQKDSIPLLIDGCTSGATI